MIYTDGVHLVADTIDELHKFASSIGLRKSWFQDHPRHPHYDIWGVMKKRAIAKGASVINSKTLIKICRKRYEGLDKLR